MRLPAAIVPLFVLLLAFSGAGLASSSSSWRIFRQDGVSFHYPSGWKRSDWCWDGVTVTPLTVLTTARTAPPCHKRTPFPPGQRLGHGEVSVWWEIGGMPGVKWFSVVKGSPTRRVGGQPARTAAITPRSGNWRATGCLLARGNLAIVTQILPSGRGSTYYLATACLRGPHFGTNRQTVRQMLASVRFAR